MAPHKIVPCGAEPDDDSYKRGPPLGVEVIRRFRGRDASLQTYRYSVLLMTFIAYSCYHASRKPFSIVKSVLDDEDFDNVTTANRSHVAVYPYMPVNYLVTRQIGANASYHRHWYFDSGPTTNRVSTNGSGTASQRGTLAGWAPFNQKGGKGLLGDVDLAFLASYSIGMYFAGHLGDRVDLRLFLTTGMLGSGFFVCLFGMGYWFKIHSLIYYLFVQVMAGLLQSTGWPSVVSIIGKWFGKGKRGLIMGIWNAHTSFGNIVGSLLAAGCLQYGWGWSFLLPGILMCAGGILMYFFLVVEPSDVGLHIPADGEEGKDSSKAGRFGVSQKEDSEAGRSDLVASRVQDGTDSRSSGAEDEEAGLLRVPSNELPVIPKKHAAVGFIEAWNIPGVAPYAFCLFFSKLVAYTFLNWLPFYITQTKIAGEYLDDKTAGNLSTLFDVGGVVGGILAGHISDKMNARAITAAGFMYLAIPALAMYRYFGSSSMALNIVLMMIAGMLVNGPYALITTAVSADLGTHFSLQGNPRALATVTAIIDGTGSVGAAIGPLITGYVSELSWDLVFVFLMVSALIAGLLLTRLVFAEIAEKLHVGVPTDVARQDVGEGSLTERLLNGRQ